MSSRTRKPIVGIPASVLLMPGSRIPGNVAAKRYTDMLATYSNCTPLVIPARGEEYDFDELLGNFHGIMLTGGRANVEPHHYDGPPFPNDEPIDPGRDNTVLPLIRAAIERKMPILGSCRGLQEMNVAMGGSLHYRIHLLPGKNDHRMPRGDGVTTEEIFKLRHDLCLKEGGLFHDLVGQDVYRVNTLHGQGIDRLADCFEVEAVTIEDDVIEAIRLRDDPTFTVGVQWHEEYEPHEPQHLLSRRLYEEFGKAAQAYADENG